MPFWERLRTLRLATKAEERDKSKPKKDSDPPREFNNDELNTGATRKTFPPALIYIFPVCESLGF